MGERRSSLQHQSRNRELLCSPLPCPKSAPAPRQSTSGSLMSR